MAKSRPRLDLEGRIAEGLRAAQAKPASYGSNPLSDPLSTQAERDAYLQNNPEATLPGDTGWVNVSSTRVAAIRFVPTTADLFGVGNLFVRFKKYNTAYVYRSVTRPMADQVNGMGQAGSGIGSYINAVLNAFPRDYCSQDELDSYFGGDGGSYRGP